MQDNPTPAQQHAAAADLAPHLQAITDALKGAAATAASSSSSASAAKRGELLLPRAAEPGLLIGLTVPKLWWTELQWLLIDPLMASLSLAWKEKCK